MNETDTDTIQLDLPASHKYLNVVSGCIAEMLARAGELAGPDELIYNVQLAVHEICANIVQHAYNHDNRGRIKITLTLSPHPRQFMVDLHDTGCAFDPAGVPAPDLDEGQVHGYGLFLARQLMDTVTYYPQAGHNRWQLVKNL